MIRFDAYTATTEAIKSADAVGLIAGAMGYTGFKVDMGKGYHHFSDRVSFTDDSGSQFASVLWGGSHGDRVMIEVKGEATPAVVERLRSDFPHRCTRVDSCADFDAPRAFERLYRQCRQVKRAHKIIGGKAGDWEDFPEKGRTLYLGSKSSVARARLYEKGKQQEYSHLNRPDWARLEVQVRPAKDAKAEFATLSPIEVWGAARWTRELAALALQNHVDPHPAGTTYRLSDRDTALAWMCRQYGAHMASLADDLGDWQSVGLTLREMIAEQQQARQ